MSDSHSYPHEPTGVETRKLGVFIDEEIVVNVSITEVNKERGRVKLLTECFKSGNKILTGEAEILVSSKKK